MEDKRCRTRKAASQDEDTPKEKSRRLPLSKETEAETTANIISEKNRLELAKKVHTPKRPRLHNYFEQEKLTFLTKEQQKSIVKYLKYLGSHGFSVTLMVLRHAVAFVEKTCVIPNDFDEWCKKFYFKYAEQLDNEQNPFVFPAMVTYDDIDHYHGQLRKILDKHKLRSSPHRIFNFGPMDLGDFVKTSEVVMKDAQTKSSNHSTAYLCVSGSGRVLPSFVVLSDSASCQSPVTSVPELWVVETSETGCMNANLFLKWFKTVFLPNCGSAESASVLLLMSNTSCVLSPDVIEIAQNHNVDIRSCPNLPNRHIQPLEHTIFGKVKQLRDEHLANYSCSTPSCPSSDHLLQTLEKSISGLSPEEIQVAFNQAIFHPITGKDRLLTEAEERYVASYLQYLSSQGFTLTNEVIKTAVLELARKFNNEIRCDLDMHLGPSDAWCKLLCSRYSLRLNLCPMEELPVRYCRLLKTCLNKLNLEKHPAQIYNFGQIELQINSLFDEVSRNETGSKSEGTESQTCILNLAVSGSGQILPPFVILSKACLIHELDSLRKILPKEWMLGRRENRHSHQVMFQDWFQGVFLPNCGISANKPFLLLTPNNPHILSLETIRIARARNVHLLHCPANSSYLIQPLENDIFGFIETHIRDEIISKKFSSVTSRYEQLLLSVKSAVSQLTIQDITAAFRAAGVIPFKSAVVEICDMEQSELEAAILKLRKTKALDKVAREFRLTTASLSNYNAKLDKLTKPEEESIMKYLQYMAVHGFPITKALLTCAIISTVKRSNVPFRLCLMVKLRTLVSLSSYILSVLPKGVIISKLNVVQSAKENFNDLLKTSLAELNFEISPDQVFNCGEKSLEWLITQQNTPPPRRPSPLVTRELVTFFKRSSLHLAVSKSGKILPPLVVVAKSVKLSNVPENCNLKTSFNGAMEEGLFKEWFGSVFLPNCGSSETKPVLLFLDNHSYVLGPEVVNDASRNNVHIFYCPGSNQRWAEYLQPLDYRVFDVIRLNISPSYLKTNHCFQTVSTPSMFLAKIPNIVAFLPTRVIQNSFYFLSRYDLLKPEDQLHCVDVKNIETGLALVHSGSAMEEVVKVCHLSLASFLKYINEETVLNSNQEEILIKYLQHLSNYGFPLTMKMLKQAVICLWKSSMEENSLQDMAAGPSVYWCAVFMTKYTEIFSKTSDQTLAFFPILRRCQANHHLEENADLLFNCGERNVMEIILASKKDKQTFKMSLHLCVSGSGRVLPPCVVLKSAQECETEFFSENIPAGWMLRTNDRGGMDQELFQEWFTTVFIPYSGCTSDNPGVLLMDNRCCLLTMDVVDIAKANNVHIIHCPYSPRLQPLEHSIFNTLNSFIAKDMGTPKHMEFGIRIGKLLEQSVELLSAIDIKNAFEHTGIFPVQSISDSVSQISSQSEKTVVPQFDNSVSGVLEGEEQIMLSHLDNPIVYLDVAEEPPTTSGFGNSSVECINHVFQHGMTDHQEADEVRVKVEPDLQPVALFLNQQYNPRNNIVPGVSECTANVQIKQDPG